MDVVGFFIFASQLPPLLLFVVTGISSVHCFPFKLYFAMLPCSENIRRVVGQPRAFVAISVVQLKKKKLSHEKFTPFIQVTK